MKIYRAIQGEQHEGSETIGLYTTKKMAEKAVKIAKLNNKHEYNYTFSDSDKDEYPFTYEEWSEYTYWDIIEEETDVLPEEKTPSDYEFEN
jgi:hypothetical protein